MLNNNSLSNITPTVKILLIINIAVYLLMPILERAMGIDSADIFGLHLPGSQYWMPWQYLTYIFMHSGFYHLFSNMFGLFMFGRILEQIWGSRRFLIFYAVCGIGAGVLNSIIGWFEISQLIDQYQIFQDTPTPELLSKVVSKQIAHPSNEVWNFIDSWISSPNSLNFIEQGKILFAQIKEIIQDYQKKIRKKLKRKDISLKKY